MTLRRALCCTLVLASLALSAPAQTVKHDIPFITDASGSYSGNLYQPAGPGVFPVIVYIHGGSWRSGSKSNFDRLANDLSAKGYAGFSIDYDLHSHSWPLSLQESNAAVSFLRAHAVEYHLDPKRIYVAGTSAGGQIAALVALEPKNHIAGAITLNGVYDVTGNYWVIHRYLGGKCNAVGTACRDASPMSQIHADAPPFFVGHGTSDHLVPFASAQLFSKEMKNAGNSVTLAPGENGGHMYWLKSGYYDATLAAIEKFLAGA